ncbi:MAG: hypothetical protein ACOY82_06990 [Pseudomonadota bacterium]
MNATHLHAPHAPRPPVAAPARVEGVTHPARYRDRDFGIGYGHSSGYAFEKRYTSDWGQSRFRFR